MNTLTTFTGGAFRWVFQVSWQAAVLVALVLIVQISLRKKLSPAWRYGLWLLVVARLLMPTSPESAVSIFNLTKLGPRQWSPPISTDVPSSWPKTSALESPNPPAESQFRPFATQNQASPIQPGAVQAPKAVLRPQVAPRQPTNWFAVGSAIWLSGVCVLGLRLVWANIRFRSRLLRHVPISDARINELVQQCAAVLGVRQRAVIIETETVESPAVWGLLRKHLLLPMGAFERFSPQELRHIFLHELAHIRRRDLEVNCLAGVLQILHWFNPILWFAFARMRADRELATDALALAHTRGAEAVGYGETILKVLEGLVGQANQPGLVGIAESKSRIKERMLAIVNHDHAKPWRWAAVVVAAVLAGIGLTSARQTHDSAIVPQPDSSKPGFTIRVLDYDSGKPLSGVAVGFKLDYYGGNSKKQEVLTDTDGRALIAFSSVDLKHLGYEARKTNYLKLRGDWYNQQLSSLPAEYEIKLAQGVELGGKVTDEDGNPVGGARISWDEPIAMMLSSGGAMGMNNAQIWATDSGEPIATTDSSGKWKAKCVWPTIQWGSFRIHHPDLADATCSTEITSAMEVEGRGKKVNFDDLAHSAVTMKLATGVTINGRVINEAGEPLPRIEVDYAELLVSQHSSDRLLGKRSAVTDAAGKFQIAHAPPKHLYFKVQPDGYAPVVAELNPKSANAELELRLVKGRRFVGQIVDKADTPVGDAHVSVGDFSIWRDLHWETRTDSNGRIEWADAPADKFKLVIEKDGFITQEKIVQAGGDKETKIRFNRTLHLTGKVEDAETKEPLKSFRLEWLDRNDPNEFERGYQFSTVPGSNGVYSVDVGRLYAVTWYRGYAHECIFRVQADGYLPAVSRAFSASKGDVGEVAYDLELKRARQIEGTVVDSAGHPVAGAQVALKIPSSKLLLSGQTSFSGARKEVVRMTDSLGKVRLDNDPASEGIVAVHAAGFAEIGTNEMSTTLTIRLEPWGQLKGTVWEYDKPLTNEAISVSLANRSWPQSLAIFFKTNTDAQGQFAFDFVPAGKYLVYRMIPMGAGASSGAQEIVRVEPGSTATVKVGGVGRPVVGRFKINNPYVAIDWQGKFDYQYAHSIRPEAPKNFKTQQEFEAWRKQPEIERAFDAVRNYPIRVAPDGSFRIDEVIPGKYEMQIQIYDPRDPNAMAYSKYICRESKSFEMLPSNDKGPLDLGTIEISLKADIKKGETAAPEFEATDMADKKFKLSELRGKFVLLDFWATWCGPCIGEFPYLKQAQNKFKDRKDFVMVSLSLDKSIKEPREFLKKNDLPWMQGYLGEWSETKVPEQYGVQGIPSIFLISPEGKIIESELEGSSMIARLEKYLK